MKQPIPPRKFESISNPLQETAPEPRIPKYKFLWFKTFQYRTYEWVMKCFGQSLTMDKIQRNQRFYEEATELVQACGMTEYECEQIQKYVYSRPIGVPAQEVGGVMNSLASLCTARNIDLNEAAEKELQRAWLKIDRIREKWKTKPVIGYDKPFVWQHVKTEGIYKEICQARLSLSSDIILKEGDILTVYKGKNNMYHARETKEFNDGRFEKISVFQV